MQRQSVMDKKSSFFTHEAFDIGKKLKFLPMSLAMCNRKLGFGCIKAISGDLKIGSCE
jgi:hypothetical protein